MHAPLAGAALALVLVAFGASGEATVLGGLALTILLWLLAQVTQMGQRAQCERDIAHSVRSILDAHLDLTRIDGVGFGDFLTFRLLAAGARGGRIADIVSFGGPAHTLERAVGSLTAGFENDVGRCYLRLRDAGQRKVDAFAVALRHVGSAASDMLHAPAYDPANPHATSDRLLSELAGALIEVDEVGNALDRAFDAQGFALTAAARVTSSAELLRRRNHAAAVLHKSAQRAGDNLLQILTRLKDNAPLGNPSEIVETIAGQQYWLLNVDPEAFREASGEAREAHRSVAYEDLPHALEAAQRLARDPSDADADSMLRDRLRSFSEHLAQLDKERMRRDVIAQEG